MAHWEIDKTFHLEYGHRVWSQLLDDRFCATGDAACACRHPHGHSGTVRVFLSGMQLQRGMVTDFKHLGFLKNFIDSHLDHKFIVDVHDPALTRLTQVWLELETLTFRYRAELGEVLEGKLRAVTLGSYPCGWELDVSSMAPHLQDYEIELLEGYFLVHFIPTSENLARFLCQAAQARLDALGVTVSRVEWIETAKSRAVYFA